MPKLERTDGDEEDDLHVHEYMLPPNGIQPHNVQQAGSNKPLSLLFRSLQKPILKFRGHLNPI